MKATKELLKSEKKSMNESEKKSQKTTHEKLISFPKAL